MLGLYYTAANQAFWAGFWFFARNLLTFSIARQDDPLCFGQVCKYHVVCILRCWTGVFAAVRFNDAINCQTE